MKRLFVVLLFVPITFSATAQDYGDNIGDVAKRTYVRHASHPSRQYIPGTLRKTYNGSEYVQPVLVNYGTELKDPFRHVVDTVVAKYPYPSDEPIANTPAVASQRLLPQASNSTSNQKVSLRQRRPRYFKVESLNPRYNE